MAKPLRLALEVCIIQAEYGYSDEETALQIQENPYLQYFCGYPGYDDEKLPLIMGKAMKQQYEIFMVMCLFRQRQYEALVDGQWVDGVADNVVQIGGMITRHWRSQKEISRFTGSLMKIAVIWSMLWRIRFIRTSLELKKKKVRLRESLLQYIKVYSASMHIHH